MGRRVTRALFRGSEGMGQTASQDMVQMDTRGWFRRSEGHGSEGHRGMVQTVTRA